MKLELKIVLTACYGSRPPQYYLATVLAEARLVYHGLKL